MIPYENQIADAIVGGLAGSNFSEADLRSLPLSDMLIAYCNWLDRGIPRRAYSVVRSAALNSNPLGLDPKYAAGLLEIERKLSSSEDLTPHLSRGILNSFVSPPNRSPNLAQRGDLDLLLNDWGLHHLHLGTQIESDGFVERTGPLLFAAIIGQQAYLIDIKPHGAWVDTELIATSVREWPHAHIALEMKGVLGLSYYPTDGERKKLRQAGINCPIEVDGKFYLPRMGLSTAGTSLQAVRKSDRLRATVQDFCRRWETNPGEILDSVRSAGVEPSSSLEWQFIFLEKGYGMVDRSTGLTIRLE